MKKLIVLIGLVVLSGCSMAGGLMHLGTIGDEQLLPEGVRSEDMPLTNIYQITSKGSNTPQVTVIAAHDCAKTTEKVPVILQYKRDGVDIEQRAYRETEVYDCGTNTLAWGSEGSTKSQLINLGQTAIQAGAFAGGMRLLRPARYNSSTSMSGGGANATSTGGSATQTTDVATSSNASTGEITATGGQSTATSQSDSSSSATSDSSVGIDGDVDQTQSNDPIIER